MNRTPFREPPLLRGERVELVPLSVDHVAALCEVGLYEELWRWTPQQLRSPEAVLRYVEEALDQRMTERALPFVMRLRAGGEVVGCTRYMAIEAEHRRLEIGSTWITPAWQRTFVNTEAKLLLLRYAFAVLGVVRVELKTDALNERSRRAILRLGAVEEGILRKHVVTWSGRVRDTVYFSILDTEWSAVEARLLASLRDGNQKAVEEQPAPKA